MPLRLSEAPKERLPAPGRPAPAASGHDLVHEEVRLGPRCDRPAILSYPDAASPRAAALLLPPHPLLGGTVDHPLLAAIAADLAGRGALVLRLPYPEAALARAADDPVIPADRLIEWLAFWPPAHDLLRRLAPPAPLFAAGYSLGARLLVEIARGTPIRRPVLVAPPLLRQPMPEGPLPLEDLLVLVGDDDFACTIAAARAFAGDDGTVGVVGGADHFLRGDEIHVAARIADHWRLHW